MGVSAGPDAIDNGLVLALDAADTNSYKTDNNLIPADTWAVSNFTLPSGWSQFGTNTENELIAAADPFGNTAVIWEGSCDATGISGSDGGYMSSFIEIDKTKTYRVSAWVNRVGLGTDGRSYHGIDCRNVGAAQTHMIYRQNGSDSLYPYFFYTSDPPPADESELPENEWVLIVGHIWPEGSGTGSSKSDTGVYNTDGTKRTITTGQPPQDLVFKSTAHEIRIKNMLYYNATDSTVTARSVYPRIDLVDGTEPSIDDLINNRVNNRYWYDLSGNGRNATLLNAIQKNEEKNGCLDFNRTNDSYARIPHDATISSQVFGTSTNFTLSAWFVLDNYVSYSTFIQKASGGSWSNTTAGLWSYNSGGSQPRLRFVFGSNVGGNPAGSYTFINYNATAGVWYNMVGTADGTNIRLYINGNLVGTQPISNVTTTRSENTADIVIGTRSYNSTPECDGRIANVSVYNRGLTASEVKQNFNALRGRFGI